jgi:hypothetical protein
VLTKSGIAPGDLDSTENPDPEIEVIPKAEAETEFPGR